MQVLQWAILVLSVACLLASLGVFLVGRALYQLSNGLLEEWRLKLVAFERIITSVAQMISEMRRQKQDKPPSGSHDGVD